MAKRVVEIKRSVTRPVLFAGAEKVPTAIIGGLGMGLLSLAWNMHSIVALVVGVFMLTVGMFALRRIGKADPMMFAVYARSLRYRRHHAAFSTPYYRQWGG